MMSPQSNTQEMTARVIWMLRHGARIYDVKVTQDSIDLASAGALYRYKQAVEPQHWVVEFDYTPVTAQSLRELFDYQLMHAEGVEAMITEFEQFGYKDPGHEDDFVALRELKAWVANFQGFVYYDEDEDEEYWD